MARILVCDDAMFMRQSLIRMLAADDHKVVAEASNGAECIEKYKQVNPDIVLMDITMPDMNGIDATKQIIAIDPNAKIIMVSAMGQRENVFEAIAAGAKDFVVKPCDQSKILSCVKKYV